jgi:protein SCO1/2
MKNKMPVCLAAMLLLAAPQLLVGESGTNAVHRSCCMAANAPAKPLTEESLYQLDSIWTNDDGKTIRLSSLRGRPQIVVMFFASCQFTCPLTVVQLKQLEAALPPETRNKVGFTLVSFDSVRDTPLVLKNYRAQHGFSSDTWTLLNGSPDSVLDLSAVLGVKFKQDAQGQFSHSNLITLLNSDGEIVHQYAGLNPDTEQLKVEIEKLIEHRK